MLNFLGVSVGEEYCKRLLDRADRDRDGSLTFPEVTETVKRSYGRNHHHHHHCSCGCQQTTTTKTYRKSPKEESVEYKTKVAHRSIERLPVFSCYR
ncbi:hypothetical protein HNY73_003379 [Argiope bruennichi]|uniref:EF-hand domain-containing protein n=1 Tax=Argiope bruennichi TaxID=94029 RepID=A0A8T0FL80_ARGBR|nr:hypothetical protein HNY73_003379 [Argiope bruennichi]